MKILHFLQIFGSTESMQKNPKAKNLADSVNQQGFTIHLARSMGLTAPGQLLGWN